MRYKFYHLLFMFALKLKHFEEMFSFFWNKHYTTVPCMAALINYVVASKDTGEKEGGFFM